MIGSLVAVQPETKELLFWRWKVYQPIQNCEFIKDEMQLLKLQRESSGRK